MRWTKPLLAALALTVALPAAALAEPTDISVRALAVGAKFIGDGMGGVSVRILDAKSGAVLAEGVIEGGTGDTGRIMSEGLPTWATRSTEGAAAFTTTVDVDQPTKLRAEVTGPLDYPHAAVTVASERWVLPGKDVTEGDGWLLELPGFVIDAAPMAESEAVDGEAALKVRVVKMCGCPAEPGGQWDADGYEIMAHHYRGDALVGSMPLAYAGANAEFEGTVTLGPEGDDRVVVTAFDPATGNAGVKEIDLAR